MVVSTPGCYIGATYKGIVVRLQGKIINKASAALRHITVVGKGVSLSSNALMYCMTHKIPIDFFDHKGVQYASVLSPQFVDETLWNKQALLPLEKKVAEAKNYSPNNKNYAADLMAMEAQGALAYWSYIRVLLADDGIDFVRREHQGATDLLNSMLNYGYAILYSRVWKNILAAKLNPSIGLLHAHQNGKPTLVFDIVEIFRSQMVDRVVISLIQKKVSLKMHNGLLSESTKRTLIRHILERLNRYEKYRNEEVTFSQIILKQSQEIAKFIAGESDTFKPYISKW